jgi:hypothetical protein
VARDLPAVGPPNGGIVYRVARGYDIFAPPDWAWAQEGKVFTNRFDDPGAYRGIPQDKRFRSIYCATRDAGAYGETIKYFRRNPNAPAGLQGGCVPIEWLSYRRIGSTQLNENLLFADFADARTFTILREELASWLEQFGLDDFDLSAMTSQHRRLTQEAARYAYELADSGHTVFAGIRYLSRLNPQWELWAIFNDRMLHQEQAVETLRKDSPGLLEAATALGLKIGC